MKEYNLKFRLEDFKETYIGNSLVKEYLKSKSRLGSIVILFLCIASSNILFDMIKSGRSGLMYYLLFSLLGIIYFSFSILRDINSFNRWFKEIVSIGKQNEKYTNPKIVIDKINFYFKSDEKIHRNSLSSLRSIDVAEDKVFLAFDEQSYMFPKKSFIESDFDDFVGELKKIIL